MRCLICKERLPLEDHQVEDHYQAHLQSGKVDLHPSVLLDIYREARHARRLLVQEFEGVD